MNNDGMTDVQKLMQQLRSTAADKNAGAGGAGDAGGGGGADGGNAGNAGNAGDANQGAQGNNANGGTNAGSSANTGNNTDGTNANTNADDSGEEYTLDGNGDLLDSTGKILFKKGEFEVSDDGVITVTKEEPKDDFTANTKTVLKDFGVELSDDIKFEPTVDGVKQLVQNVLTNAAPTFAADLLKQQPEALRFYSHLQAGGTPETFFKPTQQDFSEMNFPLDTDTTQAAKDIRTTTLREDLLRSFGYYQTNADKTSISARVEQHLQLLTDAGKLESESKLAFNNLKAQDVANKQAAIAAAQAQIDAANKAAKEQWEQVNKIIENRKFSGLEIEKQNADRFKDYITKVVKDGKTQEVIDIETEPMEFNLLVAYLRQVTKNGTTGVREVFDAFAKTNTAGTGTRKISGAKITYKSSAASAAGKTGSNGNSMFGTARSASVLGIE